MGPIRSNVTPNPTIRKHRLVGQVPAWDPIRSYTSPSRPITRHQGMRTKGATGPVMASNGSWQFRLRADYLIVTVTVPPFPFTPLLGRDFPTRLLESHHGPAIGSNRCSTESANRYRDFHR